MTDRVRHGRGAALNLTREEVAFYDALADNESAVAVMGDEKLRVIATDLLNALRTNVTVDWHHRNNARARMRTLVKQILRKYGCYEQLPPPRTQNFAQWGWHNLTAPLVNMPPSALWDSASVAPISKASI